MESLTQITALGTIHGSSGGKKNWKKENPLVRGGDGPMYIVKKEMRDKKNRFSPFKLSVKPGVDISYPHIKLKKDIKK